MTSPSHDITDIACTERTLRSGMKLTVHSLRTLYIVDGAMRCCFPLASLRSSVALRTAVTPPDALPVEDFPWTVHLVCGEADLRFTCAEEDLRAVRYLFNGIPAAS